MYVILSALMVLLFEVPGQEICLNEDIYKCGRVSDPTTVRVIAGRNISLPCEAYEKLAPKNDCANARVAWYYDVNATSRMITVPGGSNVDTGMIRYHVNELDGYLDIFYAQPSTDETTFYCEVTGQRWILQRTFSEVRLRVDECPRIVPRKGYRGNPCHHGNCTVQDTSVRLIMKNLTVKTLICHCLPGYKGEFCEQATQCPWMWLVITWTPPGILLLALVVGIFLYSYGKKEIIFKDADFLSANLKVGYSPKSVQTPSLTGKELPTGKERASQPPSPTGKKRTSLPPSPTGKERTLQTRKSTKPISK